MPEYQLQIKQVVDYPRCRIYREFIHKLINDRSIRINGGSGLFHFTVLCSYANFRTSYRRIDGISYTVSPGEWVCTVKELSCWFRTRFHRQALSMLDTLQKQHLISYTLLGRGNVVKYKILHWARHNSALEYNAPCQKDTGFFFLPVSVALELVSSARCSEMDIVLDLWVSAVYNDTQVQGSEVGPVWYKVLCVPDINQVTACADAFVPDPDICDALVLGVSLQAGADVAFQIDAVLLCGNRIVPAIGCRAIQGQSQAHRRAFCVGNPVLDIKCGFSFRSRFRLGYRRNGRFLFWTFCFLRLLRNHGGLLGFFRCRRVRFRGCAYRLRRNSRAAFVLVLIRHGICGIDGYCGSVWFCGYRLKGSRRFFLWRWSFRCVSCCLPLQWFCGASGKQCGKQKYAQYKKLFHGMTSNDCFSHIVRMHLVFFNCVASYFLFELVLPVNEGESVRGGMALTQRQKGRLPPWRRTYRASFRLFCLS